MRDHKSLVAWQVARRAALDAYRISTVWWSPPAAAAMRQLQRASLSVVLNLVEGYAWRPGAKWRHHLRIAYGSAVESVEVTEFLRDVAVVPAGRCDELLRSQRRTARLVYGLIKGAR